MRRYRRAATKSDAIRPTRTVSVLQKPNADTPNSKYRSKFYGYAVFGCILVSVAKKHVICTPMGIQAEYHMGMGLGLLQYVETWAMDLPPWVTLRVFACAF